MRSARAPGCKVVTVQGTMPRDTSLTPALCANEQGFSLHAAEPALANERVQISSAGQVVLRLKTAWFDGTTHIAPVAAGVHSAPAGAGATTPAAPDPFGVRVTSLREVSGPPLRETRGAGAGFHK